MGVNYGRFGLVWISYFWPHFHACPAVLRGARRPRFISHAARDDLTRVKQQLYCPADERVLERSEIVKGYEYRKDEYVVVEPEEIKKIEPKTAKAMEILEFVKHQEIDPIYFESSYYLMPEEAGKKPYALLTRALEESDHVAIAKLAMHNREYTVFLRPYNGGLMLHTMYYQEEIRTVPNFGESHVNLKDSEVRVAHQLIEALAAEWQPAKYHDTFEENIKKLIKARLEGKEVVPLEKPPKASAPVDLMAALKQSLAQIGGRKKGPQPVQLAQQGSGTEVRKKAAAGRKKPETRLHNFVLPAIFYQRSYRGGVYPELRNPYREKI